PVRSRPGAPLVAVDRAQLAVLVGPLVPDRDPAFLQPAHVGVPAQEPQQLTDDRPQVQLLGRQRGEARGEVEPHLVAEDRQGPGAGAVALLHALVEDPAQEVQVLLHTRKSRRWPAGPTSGRGGRRRGCVPRATWGVTQIT